jgi:uncharacterized membrane protein YgaE (UPF0421/DUF939 family)
MEGIVWRGWRGESGMANPLARLKPDLLPSLQLSLRVGVAAALAVFLAEALRLPYTLYAMISAVIVTDVVAAKTRELAFPRLLGSAIGAFAGAAIVVSVAGLTGVNAVLIGAGVALAALGSCLLHHREAAKLAGYVCAIVLLEHSKHPWIYSGYRMLETALGIGAALLVSFVPPLAGGSSPEPVD